MQRVPHGAPRVVRAASTCHVRSRSVQRARRSCSARWSARGSCNTQHVAAAARSLSSCSTCGGASSSVAMACVTAPHSDRRATRSLRDPRSSRLGADLQPTPCLPRGPAEALQLTGTCEYIVIYVGTHSFTIYCDPGVRFASRCSNPSTPITSTGGVPHASPQDVAPLVGGDRNLPVAHLGGSELPAA